MSCKIYYFSGTGNSLAVAREIKNNLTDDGIVVPIAKLRNEKTLQVDGDIVGFVFPVYFMNIPDIITSFIDKLEFDSDPYIFAAVTCNGVPGKSLIEMNKCLDKKGKSLKAGFVIKMPGNALENTPEVVSERLSNYKAEISKISEVINNKRVEKFKDKISIKENVAGFICSHMGRNLYLTPKNAESTSECIGCGICKKVCPKNNIEIINNRPKCSGCLACFHWCPKKAVKGGALLNKREQYHHPEISISDMDLNK